MLFNRAGNNRWARDFAEYSTAQPGRVSLHSVVKEGPAEALAPSADAIRPRHVVCPPPVQAPGGLIGRHASEATFGRPFKGLV